jgi:PKD repeat protein
MVTGPAGTSTKTKVGYITVGSGTPPLQAEFSSWGHSGSVPLSVSFSNASQGNIREGITYTPAGGFTGIDTFTYTVLDNDGLVSNEGTVHVKVGIGNTAPVANNDSAITLPEDRVTIDFAGNDTDTDGFIEKSTAQIVTPASNGFAEINVSTWSGSVSMRYTPNPGFVGIDSFTYTVEDNDGGTSNVATVTVTVTNDNQPPVANDDTANTDVDTPVSIDVLDNDDDLNDNIDVNSIVITTAPSNGTADVNSGEVVYTPNSGYDGTDSFQYTVADTDGAVSNIATVTINPPPSAPIAEDDYVSTNPGVSVNVNVLSNDDDPDGSIDPGTIAVVNTPDNGSYVVHDPWLWNFGDGQISHERNPRHTYSETGNYDVTLTVTDAVGSTRTEVKPSFVRAVVYEKNIDNVDYPKTHLSGKVLVKQKNFDITPADCKFNRLFYYSCNSGNYYLDTFGRGVVHYTLNLSTMTAGKAFYIYFKDYVEGRSDNQIYLDLQSKEAIFDYYNFNRRPDQQ